MAYWANVECDNQQTAKRHSKVNAHVKVREPVVTDLDCCSQAANKMDRICTETNACLTCKKCCSEMC